MKIEENYQPLGGERGQYKQRAKGLQSPRPMNPVRLSGAVLLEPDHLPDPSDRACLQPVEVHPRRQSRSYGLRFRRLNLIH